MTRPGSSDDQQVPGVAETTAGGGEGGGGGVRRQLILGGSVSCRQSASLMANVLNQSTDLHRRYRRSSQTRTDSQSTNAAEHLPTSSATGPSTT